MTTKTIKDYYSLLGITPNATQEEIRHAYRRVARTCHPDISTEPDAEERFKELNAAYEILADATKRKVYDSVTLSSAPTPPPPPAASITTLPSRTASTSWAHVIYTPRLLVRDGKNTFSYTPLSTNMGYSAHHAGRVHHREYRRCWATLFLPPNPADGGRRSSQRE